MIIFKILLLFLVCLPVIIFAAYFFFQARGFMLKKNRKETRMNKEQMYKYQNQGYYKNIGGRGE